MFEFRKGFLKEKKVRCFGSFTEEACRCCSHKGYCVIVATSTGGIIACGGIDSVYVL